MPCDMKSKKIKLLTLLLVAFWMPSFSQGFLKKIQKKAENAASDLIVKKSSEKAEKAIDGNKQGESTKKEVVTVSDSSDKNAVNTAVTATSKYDFVSGTNVIFSENFSQDVIGEFPLKWFTNGSGEVVNIEGQQGKWVKMTSGALISPTFKFPENFTCEFDVLLDLDPASRYVYPALKFEIYDRGNKAAKVGYNSYTLKNILYFTSVFHHDFATFLLDSRQNALVKFQSEKVKFPGFQRNYRKVVHVALAVQKERIRVWMNNDKVFDSPAVVANPSNFNQFIVWGAKTKEGNTAFYYSNFKIAAGSADTRTKLLTEGKFVTNGILFDTNSDKIKPESAGLLKEIASALNEAGNIRFKITGHTDNEGKGDANLKLSIKRAEAVKENLVKNYGVKESALETDGKGAMLPLSDNATAAGKAQNRRVEFTKI